MSNPTAAMIVIGDEILSGRTRDTNTQFLAIKLTDIGIDLCQVRVVPDIPLDIIAAVNELRSRYTYIFTSGGIGPTHDDITSDCIAAAFDVPISVRDDARAILATNYANPESDLNEARLRMARIPQGAVLIDNPISKAPGYRLGNVHVMAGVPYIFEAMLEGVLPTLTGGQPLMSETIRLDRREGDIAEKLGEIAAANLSVTIGSYPFVRDGQFGTNIVVRSQDQAALQTAAAQVRRDLSAAP
jgi:molybdenum cofactor synthesis domain-containing protein